MFRSRFRLLVLPLLALIPAKLAAQSNDEISTGIQFNFSTPGARGLGLGGAFVGLADDATASFTNPAGLALTGFDHHEIAVEGKYFMYRTQYTDRGHDPGTGVTTNGVDTLPGAQTGHRTDRTSGLSFISYLIPSKSKLWTLAFYRHELANFDGSIESQGVFTGTLGNLSRALPAKSTMELDIVAYGLSVAHALSKTLSLGGSLAYYDFAIDSVTKRYALAELEPPHDNPLNSLPGHFFGPPDFSEDNVGNFQLQRGKSHTFGLNLGFQWKPLRWGRTDELIIGGVFRQGPRFGYTGSFIWGPRSMGKEGQVVTENDSGVRVGGRGTFHVPDVYSVGLGYMPVRFNNNLRITLDYQRVQYSQLAGHFMNMLLGVTADQLKRFKIDDANEIHIGSEKRVLRGRNVFSFRVGAWLDPDHKLRFASNDPSELLLAARFKRGSDQVHGTAGLGLVTGLGWKVDLGFDYSRNYATGSLTVATYFSPEDW